MEDWLLGTAFPWGNVSMNKKQLEVRRRIAGALALALLLVVVPVDALAQGETTYVVQASDWLAQIAAQQYGDWRLYPAIVLSTNAKAQTDSTYATIGDPYRIEPGWKLSIPSAESAREGWTVDKLRNAEYPSEWTQSGRVKLEDGEYSETIVPGAASKITVNLDGHMAFGLAADDLPMAAVILYTNAGGSGTFGDLYAVVGHSSQPTAMAMTSLGDRVRIESLAIEGSEIVVQMVTRGPDDPMCCPTQHVRARYALQGDQLTEIAREIVTP
jgi:hypothetical protein